MRGGNAGSRGGEALGASAAEVNGVSAEQRRLERLGQQVGGVLVGRDVHDLDFAVMNPLAHLEVAPLDVGAAMAAAAILGESQGALVVDVQDGRLVL
eukprot:1618403-Prymnesium_polylepis.1